MGDYGGISLRRPKKGECSSLTRHSSDTLTLDTVTDTDTLTLSLNRKSSARYKAVVDPNVLDVTLTYATHGVGAG